MVPITIYIKHLKMKKATKITLVKRLGTEYDSKIHDKYNNRTHVDKEFVLDNKGLVIEGVPFEGAVPVYDETLGVWKVGETLVKESSYAELVSLKNSSKLIPGRYYSFNYQAVYTQDYTFETKVSPEVEKLIIQASGVNGFYTDARSLEFPLDKITYELTPLLYSLPSGHYGSIVRREDTYYRVEAPFDFRSIRFARWKVTGMFHNPGVKISSSNIESVISRGSVPTYLDTYQEYYVDFTAFTTHDAGPTLTIKNTAGTITHTKTLKTWTYATINANQLATLLPGGKGFVYYSVANDCFVVHQSKWEDTMLIGDYSDVQTSTYANGGMLLNVDTAARVDYLIFNKRNPTHVSNFKMGKPLSGYGNTVFLETGPIDNFDFKSTINNSTFRIPNGKNVSFNGPVTSLIVNSKFLNCEFFGDAVATIMMHSGATWTVTCLPNAKSVPQLYGSYLMSDNAPFGGNDMFGYSVFYYSKFRSPISTTNVANGIFFNYAYGSWFNRGRDWHYTQLEFSYNKAYEFNAQRTRMVTIGRPNSGLISQQKSYSDTLSSYTHINTENTRFEWPLGNLAAGTSGMKLLAIDSVGDVKTTDYPVAATGTTQTSSASLAEYDRNKGYAVNESFTYRSYIFKVKSAISALSGSDVVLNKLHSFAKDDLIQISGHIDNAQGRVVMSGDDLTVKVDFDHAIVNATVMSGGFNRTAIQITDDKPISVGTKLVIRFSGSVSGHTVNKTTTVANTIEGNLAFPAGVVNGDTVVYEFRALVPNTLTLITKKVINRDIVIQPDLPYLPLYPTGNTQVTSGANNLVFVTGTDANGYSRINLSGTDGAIDMSGFKNGTQVSFNTYPTASGGVRYGTVSTIGFNGIRHTDTTSIYAGVNAKVGETDAAVSVRVTAKDVPSKLFEFRSDGIIYMNDVPYGTNGTQTAPDTALDINSTNSLENKVITAEFNKVVKKVDGKAPVNGEVTLDKIGYLIYNPDTIGAPHVYKSVHPTKRLITKVADSGTIAYRYSLNNGAFIDYSTAFQVDANVLLKIEITPTTADASTTFRVLEMV
jgi:hypothetical protein